MKNEYENLINEMKKLKNSTDTSDKTFIDIGYAASPEEIKRILKESKKAMDEYYEKENHKKEEEQKDKRFSTKIEIKK